MKKKQKKHKNSLSKDIALMLRGYRILYEMSPKNMIWRTASCICQTLSPYFSLYMSSLIVNEIARGARFESLIILSLVTVLGILGINMLVHFVARKAQETEEICWNLNELYMLKAQCRMQYKYFESPKTALLRQTIRNHTEYGGNGLMRLYWTYWATLSGLLNIFLSVALTVSMLKTIQNASLSGFLKFINSPFSSLALLVLIAINVAVQVISARHFNDIDTALWDKYRTENMRAEHYDFLSPSARIFGSQKMAMDYVKTVTIDNDVFQKSTKNSIKLTLVTFPLTALMNIVLAVYVGAKAYIGVFGIGSFVLYRGTVERFVGAVSELTGAIGRLRHNNIYLEELFSFLDLPDEMYKGTLSVEKRDDTRYEIEFRNVSFKYPASDVYALKNISFKFHIGERLAFVGMNGSGKTTFIKLLCRLYDPTEGEILLNGIDITKYKYDEYLDLFSVVFQDFSIFGFTLGENVAASSHYDRERVKDVLERVDFGERLKQYKNGLDTVLTRSSDNDGVDVSKGEAQKIALARALYKDAPFMILDEPTAALDPIAESEIYAHFNDIVTDKTAIYISHRLSSCRFCDNILVFHEGEIVQYGNHESLVADENGKYHELWHAQAKHYNG